MNTKRLISFGPQFSSQKEEMINNLKVSRYGKYLQRESIEQDIFDKLQNENCITLIYGNGGVGKSALTYNMVSEIVQAKRTFNQSVDKVFWFSDADHPGELSVKKVISEIKFACDVGVSSRVYSSVDEEIAEISKLFDRDKLSFIVIDNFETVTDPDLIDFVLYNPPCGCKIILTSKYNLRHFIDVNIISDRLEDCINEVCVPKFTYDEWRVVFCDKCASTQSIATWANKLEQIEKNSLDNILSIVYERLGGNIFGMLSAVSQIAKRQIFDLQQIKQLFSEEELFKSAFNRILSDSWKMLSETAQAVLLATMFNGTDYADLDFVCKVSGICGFSECNLKFGSMLDKAICECMDLNFMESDVKDGKAVYFLESLVYHFIFLKLKNGELENLNGVIERWICYYVDLAKGIGFCYNDTAKMQVFDPPVKRNSLMFVLDYLYERERYNEFISITRDIRYFFYTRAIWTPGDECVHIKRANAARKINNPYEEFEAIIYYLNIASKYKEYQEIEKYLARAEEIAKTCEVDGEAYFRYKHALGLYYHSCKQYEQSLKNWEEIIGENAKVITTNIHDIDAARRWRLKCALEYGNTSPLQIVEYCKDLLKDAVEHNFERSIVDYSLMIANQYLKINDFTLAKQYLNDIELLVNVVNDLLYRARYHLYLAFCLGETEEGNKNILEAVRLYKELNVPSEMKKLQTRIQDSNKFAFVLEQLKGEDL